MLRRIFLLLFVVVGDIATLVSIRTDQRRPKGRLKP